MKKVTVIEIQVVVAIRDAMEIVEKHAEVLGAALELKDKLGDVAHFNVVLKEVPLQEESNG